MPAVAPRKRGADEGLEETDADLHGNGGRELGADRGLEADRAGAVDVHEDTGFDLDALDDLGFLMPGL